MSGPETPHEANLLAGFMGLFIGASFLLESLDSSVEQRGALGVLVAFVLAVAVGVAVWRVGYVLLCKIWGIHRDD